jgi:hypothetical protein
MILEGTRMLEFVVDWVSRHWGAAETIDIEAYDKFSPVAVEAGLSRSEEGIRFQKEEFGKLFKAIGHWDSIGLAPVSWRGESLGSR